MFPHPCAIAHRRCPHFARGVSLDTIVTVRSTTPDPGEAALKALRAAWIAAVLDGHGAQTAPEADRRTA